MRTALVGVILATLLLASSVAAQEQGVKTTITGWPPYTFGADLATVLQANSTLKRGCVMNGQRTKEPAGWLCVQGSATAPIGERASTATLFLEFIQERLEMVMLMWTFDSPMSRREAMGALERELRANYAADLGRGSKDAPLEFRQWLGTLLNRRLDDTAVYVTLWQDEQSNLLAIVDAWGQPTLLLMYLSAKAAGVTQSPSPPPKY